MHDNNYTAKTPRFHSVQGSYDNIKLIYIRKIIETAIYATKKSKGISPNVREII